MCLRISREVHFKPNTFCRIASKHNRHFHQSSTMATSNHITKVALVGVRDTVLNIA